MITNWRKSSYSGNNGGACVEVGSEPQIVGIRDSKDLSGRYLFVGPEQWTCFVENIEAERFDTRR